MLVPVFSILALRLELRYSWTRMVKLWLNLLMRRALGFGVAVWYRMALEWCKYQTPGTTDTCFWYALGYQELSKWSWNYFGNSWKMLTCHFSSCDLLHKDGSLIILKSSVFCDITQYSPLKSQLTFWSNVLPPCSFSMSVDFQWVTGSYIPEDKTLHKHCYENLRSYIVIIPLPGVIAVEMTDSLAENFEVRSNDFHIHATNTICIYLWKPILCCSEWCSRMKCNLNWLNCSITQFYIVISARKLYLPFRLIYNYLGSLTYISKHAICGST
jgi:hypothetical protein